MAKIKIEGLKEVTNELNRIRNQITPNINKALADTGPFAKKMAVNAIFNKYGFKSRDYIDENMTFSVNPSDLNVFISARYEPSSLNNFALKMNKGFMVNTLRNQKIWFKGAFTVIGFNNNTVMFSRKRGDNSWRTLKKEEAIKANTKVPKPLYGPSVAGSFRSVLPDIEAPIIKHLRERYGHHASR
ncbi:hypothetical protein TUM4637_09420 [Shewanella hafniensis]|uniref:hypothetical protein n=1 Tax=Shewanella TaxID=22 RepID=UPI000CA26C63|nr:MULTISPECIES: hypothetical protein [Shewanella]AUD59145.1 hypothetical protein AYJ58_06405 [Shewanella sp. Pdp11]MCL1135416.1 hypothetical protein [Shewanella hafniensis]GIU24770.1 hypothetical protein TUM4637_09420 [Shewanella hafniensis]